MTNPEGQQSDDTAPVATIAKTKLNTVMEAASALTRLGDEEEEPSAAAEQQQQPQPQESPSSDGNKDSGNSSSSAGEGEGSEKGDSDDKRYLPEHKKPDAAPTFPEKLMKMMKYAEEQQGDDPESFCVSWLKDGKSFIIRKPDDFTHNVVPKFFKPTKFSSFTRKLYRWGFRQVNRGIGPDDPIIFGNEYFQRDRAELMSKMRSVTAASTRKAEQRNTAAFMYSGMKHQLADSSPYDDHLVHKRIMVDQLYQHKSNMMQNPSYFGLGGGSGGNSANGALSITNALRPNMMLPSSNNNGSSSNNNFSSMMMNNSSMNNLSMNSSMLGSSLRGSSMRGSSLRGSSMRGSSMRGSSCRGDSYDAMAPLPVHQFMPNQQGESGGGAAPFGCSSSSGPMNQQHQNYQNFQSNSNFYPNHLQQQQQGSSGGGGGYPNQQSTAEIVNAAIQALRYAN